MDKAKLVKSKSSQRSITGADKGKSRDENKMVPVKKRGVYVEKQEMDVSPTPKAPRRSKAGSKKFLASVLTILSQTTTGTQYPPETPDENTEPQKAKKSNRLHPKQSSKTDIKPKTEPVKKPKTKKFRSRVLNEIHYETEKTLVLKPEQDITDTPSNYCKITKDGTVSNQSIKWADFLPKLIDSETGAVKARPKSLLQIDERVAKCVLEGTQHNKQKEPEPPTMVSAPEKDEKLYKICVNLIETVYQEKPKDASADGPEDEGSDNAADDASSIKTVKSSKVHFELDNYTADKLYTPNFANQGNRDTFDIASKTSSHYLSTYGEKFERNKRQLGNYYFTSKPLTVQWSEQEIRYAKPARSEKKKWKPPSNPKSYNKTQSEVMPKRKKPKKPKNLLTVLKKELSMPEKNPSQEGSFFQALRVMAKNKRKSEKSIHFDVPHEEDYERRCRFKRATVMSPSRKHSKPQTRYTRDISPANSRYERKNGPVSSTSGSVHSLEVYGYDYKQENMFSDYSDGETMDGKVINNWNRGFKTITQDWE